MRSDFPRPGQIPQLRRLWKQAFADTDDFLDLFFSTAFSPGRCLCIAEGDRVVAALYWFDIRWGGLLCAYIYAVATDPECRGRGLCRILMSDTARILTSSGYAGALLVPQDEGLSAMYGKMGYLPATAIDESPMAAASDPVPVRSVGSREYAALRTALLPRGGVLQEGENLPYLDALARLYAGDGFLAAVSREPDRLRILEFLGDPSLAPGLIRALGRSEATVRTPGEGKPFSMYLPLDPRCTRPVYFGFAFD